MNGPGSLAKRAFRYLKTLFIEKKPEASKPTRESSVPELIIRPPSRRTEPYFIQIGFDFGTSYSKCIWRDVMTNKAHIHHCSWLMGHELPFLIPSALNMRDGRLSRVDNPKTYYPEGGLYHLKNALVKIAKGQLADPVLAPFRNAQQQLRGVNLREMVESCALYLFSSAFRDIKRQLRKRMPDFGEQTKDYMAINMAIPVADAERLSVNNLYLELLNDAWRLSDENDLTERMPIANLIALRKRIRGDIISGLSEACFVYPEVSANVQGFVRSRVSSPGIYLFSDTGGGSVDQSIFIFMRQSDGLESLTYLTGRAYPLGSSHIERIAAGCAKQTGCKELEAWREKKEAGEFTPELRNARDLISSKLQQRTEATLASAKRKLIVKNQLAELKLLFGGGGHCDYPYKSATLGPFSGALFSRSIEPDVIGLPIPRDLELEGHGEYWMRRLTVAYGLSFEKNELARFIYPKDVPTPGPEEIWQPHKTCVEHISKDEV